MKKGVKLSEPSYTMNAENFRVFVQEALASYTRQGMIVDFVLWGRICNYYEMEIKALKTNLEKAQ